MENLLNYIEDLAGREDVPDQIYKDLIEKYAELRLKKKDEKSIFTIRILKSIFTNPYVEEGNDGPAELHHEVRTYRITKENYNKLKNDDDLKEFTPMYKDEEGNWEVNDSPQDTPMMVRWGLDESECIEVEGEKYLFLSLDKVKEKN